MDKIKLFVPLGTQKFPFNRLVCALNTLVEQGLYKPEEIVMQSAVYDINPVFTHYRLISFERFNELMEKAELVITHSGVNSIISCMRLQKPLVIVPRLKKYGEHVDDHQKEIAEVMKQKYDVTVCEDLTSINTCIEVAQTFMYKPWISHNAELVNFIKQLVGGVKILNMTILNVSCETLLENFFCGVLYTPNLDHLIKLQRDREFYDIYQQAEWIVCDSQILYLVSKLLKRSLPMAIPGSSFFTAFYNYHANNPNCKIFLLGAAEGVAKKAMENINRRVGRQIVVGAHSPSYGFEKNEQECEELIHIVNESGATVLLVGAGAPKQEKWIAKYRSRMPGVKLFMALGATIDFEAGNIKRAPRIFQILAMEWFYRFLKEPKRLFRRYFIDDIQFFYYFAKQLLGLYKDPFA
jgi:N-acetylglucosaminyldiphosphoundecaprenol N-acetyl-beta-D-mannosaminyltransferase